MAEEFYSEQEFSEMRDFLGSSLSEIHELMQAGKLKVHVPTPAQLCKLMPRLREISSEQPYYIEPQPDIGATRRNCWLNVQQFINSHGGHQVTGFHLVMHHSEYYALVIPHVIAGASTGVRDVTPQEVGTEVLFLPKEGVTIETNSHFLKLSNKRKAKPVIDAAWKMMKTISKFRQRTV